MPWNTAGNIKGPKGDKGDPGNAADIAALIHAAASKTPADADELPLLDSAGSWGLRKFTWATLKSILQSLFFYRGNIIGTVSQSGGIPTGSIIQRGTNANGEFVRFADGRQICTFYLSLPSRTITTAATSVGGWTFPAAFVTGSIPYVDVNHVGGFSPSVRCDSEVVSAIAIDTIYMSAYSQSQTISPTLVMLAVGRWF